MDINISMSEAKVLVPMYVDDNIQPMHDIYRLITYFYKIQSHDLSLWENEKEISSGLKVSK